MTSSGGFRTWEESGIAKAEDATGEEAGDHLGKKSANEQLPILHEGF